MPAPLDAIIIGAGHNGLVCAAYLAHAGKRVLVLEQRERIGGAAVSEQVFPGFTFSVFSYVVSLLRPEIIRDLELARHGLQVLPLESTVTPLANGDYLAQWNDHDQNRRELARHSLRDAESYDEFGRLMHLMSRAIKPILGMLPPDPASLAPRELLGMGRLGKYFRGLGTERFHALHKLLTMSSADYLDEWFDTEALKATKSASGIIGAMLGPRSPGSVSFATLMLGIAATMWWKAWSRPDEAAVVRAPAAALPSDEAGPACRRDPAGRLTMTSRCAVVMILAGILTGVLSGLFGVGGGFVVVPAHVLLTGMGIHRAVATSLLVIALVSASGVASKVLSGETFAAAVTSLFVVGGIAGIGLGTVYARRLSPVKLQLIFAVVIVAVAVFVIMKNVA